MQYRGFSALIIGFHTDSNSLFVPKTYILSVRNALPAKDAGLRIGNLLSDASLPDS